MSRSDAASLSFVDLLYTVPVVELASRVGKDPARIPGHGWSEVALILTLITFGWLGHHTALQRQEERERAGLFKFRELRFFQFTIEVAIIIVYFALVIQAPVTAGAHDASANWEFAWITGAFLLYLVWDCFDIRIAKNKRDEQRRKPTEGLTSAEKTALEDKKKTLEGWAIDARNRKRITVGFVLLFVAVATILRLLSGSIDESSCLVIAVNGLGIGALYAYRGCQESYVEKNAQ